jgi:hypothetical protein
MSENTNENRLPPPAFPPGSRKHVHRDSPATHSTAPAEESEEQVFISPDEPLPKRTDAVQQAFISPDEPIPERKIELVEAFRGEEPFDPNEEGQVVGMDLDAHLEADEIVSGGDPHVMEVMNIVAKLADALKRRGEAGLRSSPEMSRFEATLRSYCVGYLAGRRAEDPLPPELEEPLPSDF